MDALGIETAILAGFDWGARTANVIAALWPERCKAMVSVSGYLIGSQAAEPGAAAAGGRARVVVPVLLRHRTRPRRLRRLPPRLRQADLADRVAAVELRRRDVRAQRGGVRQSRPRRHRHPQLPLAARPRAGRAAVRRARAAARRVPGDHRADDHARRRRQRRAAPRARARTPAKFTGKYAAPDDHRRHRPQPAAGSAGRLRRRDRRRRQLRPVIRSSWGAVGTQADVSTVRSQHDLDIATCGIRIEHTLWAAATIRAASAGSATWGSVTSSATASWKPRSSAEAGSLCFRSRHRPPRRARVHR